MKIQFFHTKGGGPGIFINRLKRYLISHFDVQEVNTKPDIYFSAVWRGNPPKGAKVVHRADNCYFNTLQHKRTGANKAIKLAISKADYVIYQSEFSRRICKGVLGVAAKRYSVIYNAIDQSVCSSVVPFQHSYEKLFVASAIWRPLKRPRSIVNGFLESKIPNSGLIMIGKAERSDIVKGENVFWIGSISAEQVYSYYKACSALVHISRLDACSNSVIEALSFGKPVLCNNAGGTPEIVGKDGVIVEIDPVDNYKAFPMKKPEKIDIKKLVDGYRQIVSQEWNIKREEFDMPNCAKQYYDVFTKILQ